VAAVTPVDASPPIASPAVCKPQPAKLDLAVDKLPPAVQEVPPYSSVAD